MEKNEKEKWLEEKEERKCYFNVLCSESHLPTGVTWLASITIVFS